MADRLVNLAIDLCAPVHVHATSGRRVVSEAAAFVDNNVNHWLEVFLAEHTELQSPALTARGIVISLQHHAQRLVAVRCLVLT